MSIRHINDIEPPEADQRGADHRASSVRWTSRATPSRCSRPRSSLESRVKARTEELRSTLRRLEHSNVELVAAKENAERANLSKTRFLAAASHDVLQPLNAAHLSISALADLQTNDEGRKLVRQVERSLETMDDLLRTLLDISKLDAGVVRPDIGSVAAGATVRGAAIGLPAAGREEGAEAAFPSDRARRCARTARCSAASCRTSSPTRCATRAPAASWSGCDSAATLGADRVADTGYGIPEDQHQAIYEEFHRGADDGCMPRSSGGGLGLGLSIVRRMVDALGHTISLPLGGRPRHGIPDRAAARRRRPGPRPAPPAEPERPRGYGLFGTKVLLVDNDLDVLRGDARAAASAGSARCAPPPRPTRRSTISATPTGLPDIIIADQHLERRRTRLRHRLAGSRLSAAHRAGADHHRRRFRRHAARSPARPASN